MAAGLCLSMPLLPLLSIDYSSRKFVDRLPPRAMLESVVSVEHALIYEYRTVDGSPFRAVSCQEHRSTSITLVERFRKAIGRFRLIVLQQACTNICARVSFSELLEGPIGSERFRKVGKVPKCDCRKVSTNSLKVLEIFSAWLR